jgi:hypothetical protein
VGGEGGRKLISQKMRLSKQTEKYTVNVLKKRIQVFCLFAKMCKIVILYISIKF